MKQKILHYIYRLFGWMARTYIRRHKPFVIGVNGSVGKTGCRMIIHQTLQQLLPGEHTRYTSPKNFNGELGMSLSILGVETWSPSLRSVLRVLYRGCSLLIRKHKLYDGIVLEYGIDSPGEMEFLLSIVKPHIGVFTKLDSVHSLQFGDPKAIAQEEIKMALQTREVVYLNSNDIYAQQLVPRIQVDSFFYRTKLEQKEQEHDIDFQDISQSCPTSTHVQSFSTLFQANIHDHTVFVRHNLIEKYNCGYCALALSIADQIHYRLYQQPLLPSLAQHHADKDSPLVLHFTILGGRGTILPAIHDHILYDSSYNASPQSMKAALETVHRLKHDVFPDHQITLVLGDMRELGDFEEQEHRRLGALGGHVGDYIVLVGEAMKNMSDELSKLGSPLCSSISDMEQQQGHMHYPHVWDAIPHIHKFLRTTDTPQLILVKGSQNTIFLEEMSEALLHDASDTKHLPRMSGQWKKRKQQYRENIQ